MQCRSSVLLLVASLCAAAARATDYPKLNAEFTKAETTTQNISGSGDVHMTTTIKITFKRDAGTVPDTVCHTIVTYTTAKDSGVPSQYGTGTAEAWGTWFVSEFNSGVVSLEPGPEGYGVKFEQDRIIIPPDQATPGNYSITLRMIPYILQDRQDYSISVSEQGLIAGNIGTGWVFADLGQNGGTGGTGGDPGTGGTGTNYTGPDTSWWDGFKTWLEGLFTLTDAERDSWQGLKTKLINWGPIGYYTGMSGVLNAAKDITGQADMGSLGSGGSVGPAWYVWFLRPPDVAGNKVPGRWTWNMDNNTIDVNGEMSHSLWGTDAMESFPDRIAWLRGLLASAVTVMWALMLWKRILPNILRTLS
jgi:hypothetical protein